MPVTILYTINPRAHTSTIGAISTLKSLCEKKLKVNISGAKYSYLFDIEDVLEFCWPLIIFSTSWSLKKEV